MLGLNKSRFIVLGDVSPDEHMDVSDRLQKVLIDQETLEKDIVLLKQGDDALI